MDSMGSRKGSGLWLVLVIATGLTLGGLAGCSTSSSGTFRRGPVPDGDREWANIITAEEIAAYPFTASVEEILQQHSPGFWLRRRNEPGGQITVNLRGMGTPLFVVDGVPLESTGATLGLNPRDIETIEILKHGGATSLWGLRGSNGVVLIRTRKL
jgi:TonB-dependent SusC/RagA subfamily outer membrane receptor